MEMLWNQTIIIQKYKILKKDKVHSSMVLHKTRMELEDKKDL
jgi:hypothetical protein